MAQAVHNVCKGKQELHRPKVLHGKRNKIETTKIKLYGGEKTEK